MMLMKKWFGPERGQSMVEFAVILPLLLLIALGTIDMGMIFKTYIGLTNASREGARWLSVHPQDIYGVQQRIASETQRIGLVVGDPAAGADVSLSITPAQASYSAGDEVTVTLTHGYQLLFGTVTGIPDLTLRAEATMVVLYNE